MNKMQALHKFWSSFGLTAYDEQTVPDNAVMPYITYRVVDDNINHPVQLSASIWYYSSSWAAVTAKSDDIAKRLGYGFAKERFDGGYLYITRGTPFAQRMSDPSDDMIRRIYINLQGEFLTTY